MEIGLYLSRLSLRVRPAICTEEQFRDCRPVVPGPALWLRHSPETPPFRAASFFVEAGLQPGSSLPLARIFAICEDTPMRVLSRKAIREAAAAHGEWAASLNAWFKIAKNADWKNFADVRNSWRNSDVVGRFVVFDISHNRCRLIAVIKYEWRMVYIRRILSHAEYGQKDWLE